MAARSWAARTARSRSEASFCPGFSLLSVQSVQSPHGPTASHSSCSGSALVIRSRLANGGTAGLLDKGGWHRRYTGSGGLRQAKRGLSFSEELLPGSVNGSPTGANSSCRPVPHTFAGERSMIRRLVLIAGFLVAGHASASAQHPEHYPGMHG